MTIGLQSTGPERAELYIDGDLRFHLAIAEATHNGVIIHSMRALRELIRRALMSIFTSPTAPSARPSSTGRSGGDRRPRPERARAEMRDHLMRVESDIQHACRARDGKDGEAWLSSDSSGSE